MALRKNELRVKWKKKVRKVSGAIIWRAKDRSSSGGLAAKSCPTPVTPCSLPGSSVCGILQARILEWVVISFSRESSQPRSPALQADSLPTELQVVTCIFEDQLRKDKMTVHFFKNLMLYLKNNFIRKANICYYV